MSSIDQLKSKLDAITSHRKRVALEGTLVIAFLLALFVMTVAAPFLCMERTNAWLVVSGMAIMYAGECLGKIVAAVVKKRWKRSLERATQ